MQVNMPFPGEINPESRKQNITQCWISYGDFANLSPQESQLGMYIKGLSDLEVCLGDHMKCQCYVYETFRFAYLKNIF